MKRIVFVPDRPVDRPGDLFFTLVKELGLENYEIDGDPETADFVAFIGRRRAAGHFGRKVKSGRMPERWGRAEVYVLPSTAPSLRRRFFEGIWRSFAGRVLGRDLAVRDEFKGLAPDEIKAELDKRRFPFGVLCANLVYDFNIGSVVRTANAFLAEEVCIYGRRKADLRAAMGAYVYMEMVHLPDVEALEKHVALREYNLVCFEQMDNSIPISELAWPDHPLMIFGQEGPGVPPELRERAQVIVRIPQYGSIRSLNVGVTAGIAMQDWHSKKK